MTYVNTDSRLNADGSATVELRDDKAVREYIKATKDTALTDSAYVLLVDKFGADIATKLMEEDGPVRETALDKARKWLCGQG